MRVSLSTGVHRTIALLRPLDPWSEPVFHTRRRSRVTSHPVAAGRRLHHHPPCWGVGPEEEELIFSRGVSQPAKLTVLLPGSSEADQASWNSSARSLAALTRPWVRLL